MSNDGTNWHSDDELASALERAMEIPAEGQVSQPQSNEGFSDLFAALVEPEAPVTPSLAPPSVQVSVDSTAENTPTPAGSEQVFESLDDFRPRTNFVPVVAPSSEAQPEIPEAATSIVAESPAQPEVPTHVVPVTSAQVTQPVKYDRQRRTFDEIVFGVAPGSENS